jgi:hypothetical protein
MKRYTDEWWQGVKDFNNSFPINIFKKDKEIIMNPDILPTLEEWQLVCKMVKQQRELTDAEIKEVYGKYFDVKNCDWLHIECIRAILQKASEK